MRLPGRYRQRMDARLPELTAVIDGALIALDFDGTASEIVPDPATARPVAGIIDALSTLAAHGARVAIVTGRDVATLLTLAPVTSVPGVTLSGLHGAELWRGGVLKTRAEPAGLDQLRESLPPILRSVDQAAWLEDKRLSLVVHTRTAVDPDDTLRRLRQPVTERAGALGLDVVGGKYVLEIRIPGLSKADALAELLTPATTGALFAGDDLGDLPALAAIRSWGFRTGRPAITVAIGDVVEVQRAAQLQLSSPVEFAKFLSGLSQALQ
jgi:trehalose 6-phosphate phosphatase